MGLAVALVLKKSRHMYREEKREVVPTELQSKSFRDYEAKNEKVLSLKNFLNQMSEIISKGI